MFIEDLSDSEILFLTKHLFSLLNSKVVNLKKDEIVITKNISNITIDIPNRNCRFVLYDFNVLIIDNQLINDKIINKFYFCMMKKKFGYSYVFRYNEKQQLLNAEKDYLEWIKQTRNM